MRAIQCVVERETDVALVSSRYGRAFQIPRGASDVRAFPVHMCHRCILSKGHSSKVTVGLQASLYAEDSPAYTWEFIYTLKRWILYVQTTS